MKKGTYSHLDETSSQLYKICVYAYVCTCVYVHIHPSICNPFKLWILTIVITHPELDSTLSELGHCEVSIFNSRNQKSTPEK